MDDHNKIEMPLVSILIPAYNVEHYVTEAIKAVMAQTYPNLEIIVIDDGSQDDTFSILNNLARQDKRIRLYRNDTNIGLIRTLNKGIDIASGEYIARTDADDITKPDWIYNIVKQLILHPDVMAMSAHLIKMPESTSIQTEKNPNSDIYHLPLTHEEIYREMLFRNPMNHSAIILHTSVFREYGLRYDENYPHAEDYKLWFEISKIGRLANFNQPLLYYRIHPTQVSCSKQKIQKQTARKIRREVINHYLAAYGIDFNIPKKPTYTDINLLADVVQNLPEQDIWTALLYDFYLSQQHYKWCDWWHFQKNSKNTRFSREQRLKILKKYLRPWKYWKPL